MISTYQEMPHSIIPAYHEEVQSPLYWDTISLCPYIQECIVIIAKENVIF